MMLHAHVVLDITQLLLGTPSLLHCSDGDWLLHFIHHALLLHA